MLAILGVEWWYLHMAYLVGKKQKGKTYYYLTESARVDGKPRFISQQYLGSAEEIAQRLSESGPGEPDRSRHLAFGDLAAVWGVLDRLGVAEFIDEVVGSRRSDAAASVGIYIALATLNRVVAPCSKLAFAEWWGTTAGERVVGHLSPGALDHRRFWDAMDMISPAQLIEIERRIAERMVETYEVDVSGLALDMTNFATFIDSANDRALSAKRGKAKQKRNDLRLVGSSTARGRRRCVHRATGRGKCRSPARFRSCTQSWSPSPEPWLRGRRSRRRLASVR